MSAIFVEEAVSGIELVSDRGSKEPFDPALKVNAKLKQKR